MKKHTQIYHNTKEIISSPFTLRCTAYIITLTIFLNVMYGKNIETTNLTPLVGILFRASIVTNNKSSDLNKNQKN
jgi:hypothetical protein